VFFFQSSEEEKNRLSVDLKAASDKVAELTETRSKLATQVRPDPRSGEPHFCLLRFWGALLLHSLFSFIISIFFVASQSSSFSYQTEKRQVDINKKKWLVVFDNVFLAALQISTIYAFFGSVGFLAGYTGTDFMSLYFGINGITA
jgi:hypothetical protein